MIKQGDVFTISGVYEPDTRSRWRRFLDWLLRRPAPVKRLKRWIAQ